MNRARVVAIAVMAVTICSFTKLVVFARKTAKIVFLFRISTIKTLNLPICLRSVGFKLILGMEYCQKIFNALYGLKTPFP